MKNFLFSLPWSDIFSWIGTVGIPALVVLWRRAAGNARTSNKMVEAMITGIENSGSTTGGHDTTMIKRSIRDASSQAGVSEQLDKKVSELTPTTK